LQFIPSPNVCRASKLRTVVSVQYATVPHNVRGDYIVSEPQIVVAWQVDSHIDQIIERGQIIVDYRNGGIVALSCGHPMHTTSYGRILGGGRD